MRAAGGYKSIRFDIMDAEKGNRCSNYMDITSTSGFAHLVLHSRQ